MTEPKFYICKHCGNIIGMIQDSGVPVVCCGEKMTPLVANTTDGAKEKHVPFVEIDGNTINVKVGSVEHPMTEEHSIQWIFVATAHGGQKKELKPGDVPAATFMLKDDVPVGIYAYCNLHGLWKTTI